MPAGNKAWCICRSGVMRVLHVQRVQQSSKPAEMLSLCCRKNNNKIMKIEKKPTCIDTAVAEADRLPAACAADAWAATAALNIWKYRNGQGKIFFDYLHYMNICSLWCLWSEPKEYELVISLKPFLEDLMYQKWNPYYHLMQVFWWYCCIAFAITLLSCWNRGTF